MAVGSVKEMVSRSGERRQLRVQCIKPGGATSSSKPSSCDFDFLCLDWRLPGHLPQRLAAFVIAPQRNFHMIIFIRWNMPPSRVGLTASVRPVEATPALHATLVDTENNLGVFLIIVPWFQYSHVCPLVWSQLKLYKLYLKHKVNPSLF